MAFMDLATEFLHMIQYSKHLSHYIFSIGIDRLAGEITKGCMEHGPILRLIDFFAIEHGFNSFCKSGFAGQLNQHAHCFLSNDVFRIIEKQVPEMQ